MEPAQVRAYQEREQQRRLAETQRRREFVSQQPWYRPTLDRGGTAAEGFMGPVHYEDHRVANLPARISWRPFHIIDALLYEAERLSKLPISTAARDRVLARWLDSPTEITPLSFRIGRPPPDRLILPFGPLLIPAEFDPGGTVRRRALRDWLHQRRTAPPVTPPPAQTPGRPTAPAIDPRSVHPAVAPTPPGAPIREPTRTVPIQDPTHGPTGPMIAAPRAPVATGTPLPQRHAALADALPWVRAQLTRIGQNATLGALFILMLDGVSRHWPRLSAARRAVLAQDWRLGAAIAHSDRAWAEGLLDAWARVGNLPNAEGWLDDFASGIAMTAANTMSGTRAEILLADRLMQRGLRQGEQIVRVSDRIGPNKAGDIITNQRIFDSKELDLTRFVLAPNGRLTSRNFTGIMDCIAILRQARSHYDRYRAVYPHIREVVFDFPGSAQLPQLLGDALENPASWRNLVESSSYRGFVSKYDAARSALGPATVTVTGSQVTFQWSR